MAAQSWKWQMKNNPNFFNEFRLNTNPAHGATYLPIGEKSTKKDSTLSKSNHIVTEESCDDFSGNMSHEEFNESQSDYSIS